jgi:hypothetical protein
MSFHEVVFFVLICMQFDSDVMTLGGYVFFGVVRCSNTVQNVLGVGSDSVIR